MTIEWAVGKEVATMTMLARKDGCLECIDTCVKPHIYHGLNYLLTMPCVCCPFL